MAKIIRQKGSGITARDETRFQAPFTADDRDAIMEMFGSFRPEFDYVHGERVADLAQAVLRNYGLPTDAARLHEYPDGNRRGDLASFVLDAGHQEESVPHLAAIILRTLLFLRDAIRKNDANLAARFAFEIGAATRAMTIKMGWERHALSGSAAHAGAVEGGKRTSKDDRDIELAQEYLSWRERNPHLSKSAFYDSKYVRALDLKPEAAKKALSKGLRLMGRNM